MGKTIFFIAVCLALFEYSQALKCYNCTHAQNECLQASFDPSKIVTVDCTGLSLASSQGSGPVCLKRILKDKITGVETTYRRCLQVSSPNDCKSSSNNLEIVDCKTCNTDLCNESSGISSTFALFAVPLFYVFTKMLIN